jgi:DME family drug/metabolite transporter
VYLVGAKSVFDAADPVYAAGVVFAGAAIVLAPVALASDIGWVATGRGALVALWLAPIATGVSYVFFSRGLQSTGVAVAATMTLAEPLTATLLGLLVLSEPARLTTVIGIALIVTGLGVLLRES